MGFHSVFDALLSRSARPLARPKRHPATRLVCETLEDRCLLSYTLTDLGGVPVPVGSAQAAAVNNEGQVVGSSSTSSGYDHAFLWQDGVLTDLGSLGGSSYATSINDAGQVVGYSYFSGNSTYHAFLWQAGVLTDLGTLGGNVSKAYRINDQGLVFGTSGDHVFRWQDGVMTDLGALGTLGGTQTIVNGMNDQGEAVGSSTLSNGGYHAFLWQNGRMTDLGGLAAYGINDQGQVVGEDGDLPDHAFLWQNGVMTNLGDLGDGNQGSRAYGINNEGQVVGESSGYFTEDTDAFLWQNGVMTDLGGLSSDNPATAINDQGVVVGSSYPYPTTRAFLWQAGVFTDLGSFGGPATSSASGINGQGEVVGSSPPGTSLDAHAFTWQDGEMTDLGTLPAFRLGSQATAINDAGQVVGGSFRIGPPGRLRQLSHAFLWQDGVMRSLGTLGGDSSFANAINDAGQVVGWSALHRAGRQYGFKTTHAFLWDQGTMTDLGTLGGYPDSEATAINDAGQVVGDSSYNDELAPTRAFLWQAGVMTDLGTLGGRDSYATGVNDQGVVVGYSQTSGIGYDHAFLWQDGVMTDLGTLPGDVDSDATAINGNGQVVGYSSTFNASHAVLWQGGVLTDLNRVLSNGAGWILMEATAINASGQIVGYGLTPSRLIRAYLLTPDASPAAAGRLRFDVTWAQAARQPHALLATGVAPGPESQRQSPPPATLAGGSIQPEATSASTPVVTLRHAQDAAFTEWTDPLRDTLHLDLTL